MKIKDTLIVGTEKKIAVCVTYNNKEYVFDLVMTDGRVCGTYKDNIRTSTLTYFDLPIKERQRHFNQIKKYLEANVS